MTVFGWFTVVLWIFAGVNSKETNARLLCALMTIGTLVWGTGSL